MDLKDSALRRETAGGELNQHLRRDDGYRVASSLSDGLTTLRTLFFTRIHEDVEAKIGTDSMLMPVSPIKSERAAHAEIELFYIAESICHATARNYVADRDWFASWLCRMRLGENCDLPQVKRRMTRYLDEDADARRLTFSAYLERTYPEARRAPLVLYRLIPLAVGIVTAVAFGHPLDANELRNQQAFWLPSIHDCHECYGAVLDNAEKCRTCGNPIWMYRWLTAAD